MACVGGNMEAIMSHNRASVSPGCRLGVCVHKIASFVYVGFYFVTASGCHSVSACEMHNNAMMTTVCSHFES